MALRHVGWLRDRFQDHLESSTDSMDGVSSSKRGVPHSAANDDNTALDLVDQVAEMISGIEDCANATHARAQCLVEDAIEKLKLADGRVQSAASDRRAAIDAASGRLEKAVEALERAESRIASAEWRAQEAEERAEAAETALRQIEEAIRTQLLGERRAADGDLSVAA